MKNNEIYKYHTRLLFYMIPKLYYMHFSSKVLLRYDFQYNT